MVRASPLLLASFVIATSAIAAPSPRESWGKAGVSLAQYRQDAIDCGKQGYYTDISKTDDAKAFVNASRQLDTVATSASVPTTSEISSTGPNSTNAIDQMVGYADQQQHIVDSVHVDQRYHHIKQTLEAAVGQCLTARGYLKFRLTDDQRHRLTKLKAGSEERRQYLYSLASNPAVLRSQSEATQP